MKTVSCILLLMFLSGCATQRYGRMIPLVDSEAKSLDCEHIEIEIDKCNAFIHNVNTKAGKFTGKDVISFLGDFGIGDSWEVNDATKSAMERIEQLQELREKKKCTEHRENSTQENEWIDAYGRKRKGL